METTERPEMAAPARFKLLTFDDVMALQPPEWLIEDILPVQGQAVLYGPSNSGKSFVALDWALSIATGQSWQGHEVKQGPVVYVVAEGGPGIKQRAAAWVQARGCHKPDRVFFVREPVQLLNAEHLTDLTKQIAVAKVKPGLVVFDTLARCFVGGEENSALDVGRLVEMCSKLQRNTGSAVLLVHHTGRNGGHERGSTALRGAADVMIAHSRDAMDIITLRNDKQKDAEEFRPIRLRLQQVDLGVNHKTGRSVSSCVLIEAADGASPGQTTTNPNHARALRVLVSLASEGEESLTARAWREGIQAESDEEVKGRTFQNWREALTLRGLVQVVPGTNPPTYQPTEEGHASGMPA